MKMWKLYTAAFIGVSVFLAAVWGISLFYSEQAVPVISYADDKSAVTALVYTPVLVDINSADLRELQTLSGIGRSTAEKIIAYRNENGGFKSAEELLNIDGIGEKKLNDIICKISISGEQPETTIIAAEQSAVYADAAAINLNKTSKDELMQIDGIGEVLAERIIEYAENTGFKEIDDLLEVDGIGEAKLEKIRPYVAVD